ncbi:MAG TPA: efflux RND transporter permease subunit, partial [Polyangiaceae bacterium]
MFDAANSILAQKISQVSGVGQVTVSGGQQPAVRVQVDPTALAGAHLGFEDVRAVLAQSSIDQPKGALGGPLEGHVISANDQIFGADAYRRLVIGGQSGSPVRLGDVATVIDSVENNRLAAWASGTRAILMIVRRQPGANIIEVIERVKSLLPRLNESISPAIKVAVQVDRSQMIRASVHDVEQTLLLTIGLVVLVVFAFLRSPSATAIPAIAVPLSLVGTFGVMYLLDYGLDNLSLMALTISTGFVVDDAIVMTENVARFIELGETPFDAALKGAKQIGFTIVSITVSLLAVFIPILLMGGVVGRLFREFAVTLSIAIAVSAVVSLTLTPMMCARVLKRTPHVERGRLYLLSERAFEGMAWLYERGLCWVLRHRPLTLAVTLGTLALSVYLYVVIPKGLFPQQDVGFMAGFSEAGQDTSFVAMRDRQMALDAIVRADPDVTHTVSSIGAANGATGNTGTVFIELRPLGPRKASVDEVIARLRPRLSKVEGITLYLQAMQDVRVGGRPARTQYQYTLQDADLDELRVWAPKVLAKLKTLPNLKDCASDQQLAGLEARLTLDRDTAARFGIYPQAIDDALYDAFGQRQVATTYTELNQYRVILEVKPELQRTPDALGQIFVRAPSGDEVPLTTFTRYAPTMTSLSINHQGQFPAVTLSFNLGPDVSLSQAVESIR